MGVPKFYRWLSERYPQINQMISDSSLLPEFDNLYLDMNGIIHACTHPNDDSTANSLTLREMMLAIFRYIDRMVTEIAKPKKLLFMAIDGVAPRAKLNQQRARRFRAAQERMESIQKAKQRGDNVDEEAMFDSNCITPGTEFMEIVGKHLRWFIRKKIKEDSLWKNLEVVFSGHDVPGEGEHKIMQYIREARAKEGYLPNQRHCMYGGDADLIMLGLATHEPHFTLLREVVDFSGGKGGPKFGGRQTVIRQTREVQYQLMNLCILREYILLDLSIDTGLALDGERLCDDFIFLTFLVGNDFLPHLPTLDIGEHAFDVIFKAYKEMLTTLGEGYIVNSGEIGDMARLEKLFSIIGVQELDILQNREAEAKEFATKRRKFKDSNMPSEEEVQAAEEAKQRAFDEALQALETSVALGYEEPSDDGAEEDGFVLARVRKAAKEKEDDPLGLDRPLECAKDFKGRYYYEKFKVLPGAAATKIFFGKLRESYLQGLMWCLAYYVKGCISWTWYFPYHYGPMLQDMVDLSAVCGRITFEIGQPFFPFQQLLGCLPPASRTMLPRAYQWLMVNPESPVLEFYPLDFGIDMDGKRNPWEAVVLLDFIDEKRLLKAESEFCSPDLLSSDERSRNSFGNVLTHNFDPNVTETYFSCNPEIGLLDVTNCQSVVTQTYPKLSPGAFFRPELIPGTIFPLAGFPSLITLPIENVETDFFKMNTFGSESKYRSISLELAESVVDASTLDPKVLVGRVVFVNYPQIHEAKVVAVTTANEEYRSVTRVTNGGTKTEVVCTPHDVATAKKWQVDADAEQQKYFKGRGTPGSGGMIIGDIKIRLRVCALQGMKRNPITGARTKVYGIDEADVPIQMSLWTPPAVDLRFQETLSELPISQLMPYGCEVVAIKGQLLGVRGRVVGPHSKEGSTEANATRKSLREDGKERQQKTVDIEFSILPPESPFGHVIAESVKEDYFPSREVCKSLRISPSLLGKIVGMVLVEPGRLDFGLNLKKNGQYHLLGYVRKVVDSYGNKKSYSHSDESKDMPMKPLSAWGAGDSVQVVGNVNTERIAETESAQWEYSAKALALLFDYKNRFPLMFERLDQLPHQMKYSAVDVFVPSDMKGKVSAAFAITAAKEVEEWLKNQPFFSMARTPLTTISLSKEAMRAVERASDVRSSFVATTGPTLKIMKGVPLDCLFRGNIMTPSDAPVSYNGTEPPKLGDRIVNLYATGVPFGLRGTIVAIHSNTGYAEAIFDEEFLGGRGLQGSCSQFRGRLCAWSALLRVSQAPPTAPAASRQKPPVQSQQQQQPQHQQSQHQQGTQTKHTASGPTHTGPQGPTHRAQEATLTPVQPNLTAALMTAAAAAAAGGSANAAEQQEAARQILLRALHHRPGATSNQPSSSDVQTKAVAVTSSESPPSKSNSQQSRSKGEALSFLLKEKLQIDDSSAVQQKPVPASTLKNTVTGTSPQFPEPLKRVNPTMIYKSRRDEAIRAQMEEVEVAERAAQAAVAELVIDANAKSNGSGRAALMLAAGIDLPPPLARSISAPVPSSSAPVDLPPVQTIPPPSIGDMLQKAVSEQKGTESKGKKNSPSDPSPLVTETAAAPASTKKTALLMSMLSSPSTDPKPVAPLSPAGPSGANKSKALLSLLSISPKKLPAVTPEPLSTSSDGIILENTALSTSAIITVTAAAPVVAAPSVSTPAVVPPVVAAPSAVVESASVAAAAAASVTVTSSSTVMSPALATSSPSAETTAESDAVVSSSATSEPETESCAEDIDVDLEPAAPASAPAPSTSSFFSISSLIPSHLLMKKK